MGTGVAGIPQKGSQSCGVPAGMEQKSYGIPVGMWMHISIMAVSKQSLTDETIWNESTKLITTRT